MQLHTDTYIQFACTATPVVYIHTVLVWINGWQYLYLTVVHATNKMAD